MEQLFLKILNMSITASYVIIFVILIRFLFKKAPKIFSYALWSIVLFRLICPFSFESVISFIPVTKKPLQNNTLFLESSKIDTGITEINNRFNIPATSIEKTVSPIDTVLFVISIIWIVGVLVLLIYSVFSFLKLKRTLKSVVHIENNIYESESLTTPFVLGIIKPKIYLPTGLSKIEKSYILKHEQVHIKRFDYIIKPVAFFILCIHWFNPLAWISFILMSKDMEMSCDEAVLKEMGNSIKKEYSSSLLSLSVGWKRFSGTPLAFGENNVRDRIKNVLNYKRPSFWAITALVFIIIVVGVGLISNPKSSEETTLAAKFLKNKTEYVGDASKVGNIISLLEFSDKSKYDHFELHTNNKPYGATIYIDASMEDETIFPEYCGKNAFIMFSLIGNLDYINYNLSYDKVRQYSFTYNREWANIQKGKNVREFAESEKELNKLIYFKGDDTSNIYNSMVNELKAYSEKYSVENAKKDEIFTIVHGQLRSDINMLNNFLQDTGNKKPSEITILQYTTEGDPIFTKVLYDGQTYCVVKDYSRDKFKGNSSDYQKLVFKFLKVFDDNKNNSQRAFLTNNRNLSIEKLNEEGFEIYSFTK